MAIGAATIWRVRPSGNSANGSGYDATISGAGTDYSQQNSAQYAAADLTGTTSTVVSATAGFTSAMVGNAMQITGGGATAGFYFIITFTNATTVVLDRSPGTITNATFKVGGGITAPFLLMDSSKAAGNKAVAGNTIYILGAGGAPDYSITPIQANPPVTGDTTNGAIRMIGEGTVPVTIWLSSGDNYMANGGTNLQFQGLSFKPSAVSNGRLFDCSTSWLFDKCTFNMNDLNTAATIGGCLFMGCEFFSKTSGAPTAHTSQGLLTSTGTEIYCIGCNFHDLGLIAINPTSSAAVIAIDCVFAGTNNASQAPYIQCDQNGTLFSIIKNCTFDNTVTDAVRLTTAQAIGTTALINNIFSNNTGAGKYGLDLTTGTTAPNTRIMLKEDFNDFYNNTADVNALTKGANDLALNPNYSNQPSNLTLTGTNLRGNAYPNTTILGNTNERNYGDFGALQEQNTGGGPIGQLVKVASIGTY